MRSKHCLQLSCLNLPDVMARSMCRIFVDLSQYISRHCGRDSNVPLYKGAADPIIGRHDPRKQVLLFELQLLPTTEMNKIPPILSSKVLILFLRTTDCTIFCYSGLGMAKMDLVAPASLALARRFNIFLCPCEYTYEYACMWVCMPMVIY